MRGIKGGNVSNNRSRRPSAIVRGEVFGTRAPLGSNAVNICMILVLRPIHCLPVPTVLYPNVRHIIAGGYVRGVPAIVDRRYNQYRGIVVLPSCFVVDSAVMPSASDALPR